MSQYLSHMAALAVDTALVIQPRLASRFEGAVGAAPTEDFQTPVAEAAVSRSAPAPAEALTPATPPREHRNLVPETAITKPSVPLLQSQPLPPVVPSDTGRITQPTAAPKPQVSVQELIRERIHEQPILLSTPATQLKTLAAAAQQGVEKYIEQSFFTETRHEVAPASAPEPLPTRMNAGAKTEAAASANKAPVIQTRIATLEANIQPAPRPDAQAIAAATAARSIQVSIGRIEIRAQPVNNPQTPKTHAKPSTLSLNDYLKQRKGDR